MASIEEVVDLLKSNRQKMLRYMAGVQLLLGLFLLFMAYYMGHTHLHLIRSGGRAPGRVVGYQQHDFISSTGNSRSYTTGFLPVVEFNVNGRDVRFTDWLGSSSTGRLPDKVTVLYDVSVPSIAMIDRPVMNWIPWAPIAAVGCFLCIVGLKGFLRSA
jgi:hypothetical protein